MNINRLIYPGFWFGKTDEKDAFEMARRGAGGFCIYGGTRESVQKLAQNLRAASPHEHLFICADYEDGLGRWIKGEAWVLSNLAIGASDSEDIAYQKGLTLAREARELGVDWVFAPVLDLCDEPQNPIVNTRSFGKDPVLAGRLGAALCRGLHDGGVLNSLKHFPGHGRTAADSHLELPVLNRTLAQLRKNELLAFQAALPYADSVMAGHLFLPEADGVLPASQSAAVLTGLLKKEMGFQGLVLTDALCMKAIGEEKEASLNALRAGAHVLLSAQDSVALSDFLQKQTGLKAYARHSARLQDALAARLARAPKQGLPGARFNAKYAASCAVLQGSLLTLKPGGAAAYLELGNEEDFAAQTFLNALKKAGIQIKKPGEKADALVAASFSNYKAFKGHINLSPEEKRTLSRAAAQYPKSVFVSFGSPFGAENISALTARLFMFSPALEAQVCAADILLGKQKATGVMPA